MISLHLWSGYCQDETGAVHKDQATMGITGYDFTKTKEGKVKVGIAIEILQPLVTGGLNEDERLVALV